LRKPIPIQKQVKAAEPVQVPITKEQKLTGTRKTGGAILQKELQKCREQKP
jgi:hypothetical protein